MFHIFVYEHCFTISLVRNLESNVLTYLNKYGKERIGKAPHIGEYAWLNVMYPCVTETEVCDLEKRLGVAIPKVYKDFLMNVSNGFDIMNCTLALHGCRTPMTEAIWIHGIFWVLMNMTAQNSISIRWMIRYAIVTAMMRHRLNHGIRYRQC